MVQAESSRREAFEEAVRRGKAEKDAIEAIHRVKFLVRLSYFRTHLPKVM